LTFDDVETLEVLPGLEIHVHATASAEAQGLARAVVERLRRAG
jgi:hypothetical protein